MTPLTLLLYCLPVLQDPAVQEPAPGPRRLDVIVLQNGERFEGRITTELDGYVEFQLDEGAIVGVARNRIQQLLRGAGRPDAPVAAALEPRDEWFVLHDASGIAVGWLHAAVVVKADGTVTASEEYEFADGQRRYQVTSMCDADSALQPQRCYFRERVTEPVLGLGGLPAAAAPAERPDRVVDERIVEARCEGDQLVVTRANSAGREERSYAWVPGSTFPLLAGAIARATGDAVAPCEMFDPAAETITTRGFSGARRRAVTLDGETRQVTEIVESGTTPANAEWLDGSMRTLRRELAGPALVAVPGAARSVRAQVGQATIPAALAREAEGQFGLWVPNPAWELEQDLSPGEVVLACEAHGASIGLVRIDHLAAGTRVDVAADAVTNWFRLLHPGLQILRRESVTARDRRGVRLVAEGRVAAVRFRATVDVIPHHDRFFVLTCRAPVKAWDELAADFAFVGRTLEFDPEAVEPPLQGPLRERAAKPSR